jgi:hypothetical protein
MQRSSRVDYDVLAELYDSTPHREKSADPELIAFLAGRAPTATLTLLDIACGTGNQQIANRGLTPNAKFVGLDGSLGMLRQAQTPMEFEAPSVWPIASKHTVTFHNLAALGLKRPPQSLSTSPRSMPRPQRALDVVSDKASKNLGYLAQN